MTPDTDVTPDTEVTPDVVPDVHPDVVPDVLPDVELDILPEVEADTGPDTDTITPPTGESCSDPHVIVVPSPFNAPIDVTGDTTGMDNDHAVDADACPGMDFDQGQDAPDEVWSFTAPTAGVYRISVLSSLADVGFYVLATCGDAAECLGGSDFEGVGADSLDTRNFRMAQGQMVFIVVDGCEAANFGTYTLTIAPPVAFVPGDICDDPIVLTLDELTGAYVGSGDNSSTTALTDAYAVGECGPDFLFTGSGSQDQVFSFTVPTAGTWTATLSPADGADLILYGYLGATCGQTCAGASDGDGDEEIVLTDLAVGDNVFLVVDAILPGFGGAFTLSVTSVCEPSCDGESCGGTDGCGSICGCPPAKAA